MNTAMSALDTALCSANVSTVLAGAWDALDLAGRLAHAITWDETSDELHALTAALECSAGRALLPLPDSGQAVVLKPSDIGEGTAGLAPYVALLHRTHAALADLAGDDVQLAQLSEAARHAAAAADALAAVRGQQ